MKSGTSLYKDKIVTPSKRPASTSLDDCPNNKKMKKGNTPKKNSVLDTHISTDPFIPQTNIKKGLLTAEEKKEQRKLVQKANYEKKRAA